MCLVFGTQQLEAGMGGERHFVLEERQMAFHLLACFKAIPPNAEGQTKKLLGQPQTGFPHARGWREVFEW